MTQPRLTTPLIAVLKLLLEAPDNPAWGLQICRETDLGSGTVYPLLARLAIRGWVVGYEEDDAHPGRPSRRYFKLTSEGRLQAELALEAREARLHRGGGK